MSEKQSKSYWRQHKNGTMAWVGETHLIGKYAVHVSAAVGTPNRYSGSFVAGLERAKAAADVESACPQPCACPSWHE
jgi:hypothetical protein